MLTPVRFIIILAILFSSSLIKGRNAGDLKPSFFPGAPSKVHFSLLPGQQAHTSLKASFTKKATVKFFKKRSGKKRGIGKSPLNIHEQPYVCLYQYIEVHKLPAGSFISSFSDFSKYKRGPPSHN
jgi:hypothetical protein